LLSSDKFEFIVIYGRRRVRKTAAKIIKELVEKTWYVQWHNEKRKKSFTIFAKSFSKKILK